MVRETDSRGAERSGRSDRPRALTGAPHAPKRGGTDQPRRRPRGPRAGTPTSPKARASVLHRRRNRKARLGGVEALLSVIAGLFALLVAGAALVSFVVPGHATPRMVPAQPALDAAAPEAPPAAGPATPARRSDGRSSTLLMRKGLARIVADPDATAINLKPALRDITIAPPAAAPHEEAGTATVVPAPERDLATGRWLMVSLINPSSEHQVRTLVLNSPTLAGAGLFGAGVRGLAVKGAVSWAEGAPARPLTWVETRASSTAYEVRLTPNHPTTVALLVDERAAPYTLALWDAAAYRRVDRLVAGAKGVVVGVLMTLIALTAGRWVLQGGRDELAATAFAAAGLVFVSAGFGVPYTLIAPDAALAGGLRAASLMLLSGAGLFLVLRCLPLAKIGPDLPHLLPRAALGAVALAVLALPGGFFAALAGPVALASSFFCAGVAVVLTRTGDGRASALVPGLALIVLCTLAATLLSVTVPGPLADLQSMMLTGGVAAGVTLCTLSCLLTRPGLHRRGAGAQEGHAQDTGEAPGTREGEQEEAHGNGRAVVVDGPRATDLALEAALEGIWDYDVPSGRLTLSPMVEALLGERPGALSRGLPAWLSRVHPDDLERFKAGLKAQLARVNRTFDLEARVLHCDQRYRWLTLRGKVRPGPSGEPARLVAVVRDETGRRMGDMQAHARALFDGLTGLAGRGLLLDRLERLLVSRRAQDPEPAIILIDLDHFRTVNEVMGPGDGDLVLIALARRLEGLVDDLDTVARVGGDEFAILLSSGLDEAGEDQAGRLVCEVLSAPIALAEQDVTLTACAGIACVSGDRTRAEDVLAQAEIALSRAKSKGASQVYALRASPKAPPALMVESALKAALTPRRLALTYEPVVDLQRSRLGGFDAALHGILGAEQPVPPEALVRRAEASGAMKDLGLRMVEAAVAQIQDWQRRWPTDPPLFVTLMVPSVELFSLDFADEVRTLIARGGLPARSLRLAADDAILSVHPEATAQALRVLAQDGVGLALDNFGAGFGSVARLAGQPLQAVRLPASLVAGVADCDRTARLLKGLAGMIHDLDIEVLGIGADSEAEVKALRDLGLDFAQGAAVGGPQSPERAASLLTRMLGPERGAPVETPGALFGQVDAAE